MKKISEIFLGITLLILLMWLLPNLYDIVTAKPRTSTFALYSTISGEFITTERNRDGDVIRKTDSGRELTANEVDSLLPLFYVKQLLSTQQFPDTIKGVAVSPLMVQQTNFIFRSRPSDINVNSVQLYPLLESMSNRVELEMPEDLFRITNTAIEFIDINTNSINAPKTAQYTDMLLKKGFTFPAKIIAGNGTVKKDYDEGYLLLDKNNKLFHLKRTVNRPYVRAIDIDADIEFTNIFVTEFRDKKVLALLTDTNNNFYILNRADYSIVKSGIDSFNPETDEISIIGNMFDWTVAIGQEGLISIYALDANDYSTIKVLKKEVEESPKFGITFTSKTDKYVKPRLK